jgi:undecaprenyl-diphosphatase
LSDWIESLVLGVVQGLTEFLPISSDGHLNVVQKLFALWTGKDRPEEQNIFFFVMLHIGTMVAILAHYWTTIQLGAKGFLWNSTDVPEPYRRPAIFRVGLLAVVATLPLIPDKLFFMKWIERSFGGLHYTAVGFLITAAILLLSLRMSGGEKGPAETSFLDALLVGIAQMFAPLPGVSRSGLTIAAALGLGFSRVWAVGFSLLLAVPAIVGASVFEIRKVDRSTLTADRISQTIVATIIAGLIGYAAIVWLVRIVRKGYLWYFSVYLVVLAVTILILASLYAGRSDGSRQTTLDRPVRSESARSSGARGIRRSVRAMDRGDSLGTRSSYQRIDASTSDCATPAGLVLGRSLAGGSLGNG